MAAFKTLTTLTLLNVFTLCHIFLCSQTLNLLSISQPTSKKKKMKRVWLFRAVIDEEFASAQVRDEFFFSLMEI